MTETELRLIAANTLGAPCQGTADVRRSAGDSIPGKCRVVGALLGQEGARVECENLFLLLLHALGCAAAWLGRAAEGRVVTASPASVLQFGDVAFAMADDSQR